LAYPDQKQKVLYFTAYQVPVTEHNLYLHIRQRFVLRGIIVVKDGIVYFRYMDDVGLSTIVGGSPLDGVKKNYYYFTLYLRIINHGCRYPGYSGNLLNY
jgi:hypothetical protein